jgi:Protein of unknown function (DUF2934)
MKKQKITPVENGVENPVEMEQRIRNRAYEIWLHNGAGNGSDVDHWLIAESEIRRTFTAKQNLTPR